MHLHRDTTTSHRSCLKVGDSQPFLHSNSTSSATVYQARIPTTTTAAVVRIDATLVCESCLTGRFGLQVLRKTRTWSMTTRGISRTRRASRRSRPARGSPGIGARGAKENRTDAPTGIRGSTAVRICPCLDLPRCFAMTPWTRHSLSLSLFEDLILWPCFFAGMFMSLCDPARDGSFVGSLELRTMSYQGDMWPLHAVHQLWIPWRTFHPNETDLIGTWICSIAPNNTLRPI